MLDVGTRGPWCGVSRFGTLGSRNLKVRPTNMKGLGEGFPGTDGKSPEVGDQGIF